MIPNFRSQLMAKAGLVVCTVLLIAASASSQAPNPDPSLERMRKDIFFLAGPECEGRGVETQGINKAADLIAATFKAAGLKPAMKDGSYFQPFTVTTGAKLGTPTHLTLTGPNDQSQELKQGSEFNPLGFSPTAKAAGALVFAGYGITAPKLNYDDYAGISAAGKVVVVLRRTPRPGKSRDGRFDTTVEPGEDSEYAPFAAKIDNAIAHKAAAMIVVSDVFSAGRGDSLLSFSTHARGTDTAPFPVLQIKREVLNKLLKESGQKPLAEIEKAIDENLKPASVDLTGWKADAEVTAKRTEYNVKNVEGYLEGSGPLANETIVLGAHYDHLGYGQFGSMGGAAARGKVHFGADDNGSGTTGLLEMARRFGAMKNREGRRIVFIAFSGEERGLLGSMHYCKQPLFPLKDTAAMLNMDMIGRTKPVPADWLGVMPPKDRLIIYGTGSGESLDKMVDNTMERHDFKLSKLPTGTGPSDHDSFYRKGVPVLFFYTGTHGQYHQPTDVPEMINLPGLKKVVDLVSDLAEQLAYVPRPKYLVTKDPWLDPTETRPAGPAGPKLRVQLDYNYEGQGALIETVTPGGAAEKAGLKDGDVIVEIGGKPVRNVGSYMTAMAGQKPGRAVDVVVLRKGQKQSIKVTPE